LPYDVIGSPSIHSRKKSEIDWRTFSGHQFGAEDLRMNSSSLFMPSGITADLPPPLVPTTPLGLIVFLLFCAAAFFCLRMLFRRRSKISVPKIEGGDAGMRLPAKSMNGHPTKLEEKQDAGSGRSPKRQTEQNR
jgi:hypothetical protein